MTSASETVKIELTDTPEYRILQADDFNATFSDHQQKKMNVLFIAVKTFAFWEFLLRGQWYLLFKPDRVEAGHPAQLPPSFPTTPLLFLTETV